MFLFASCSTALEPLLLEELKQLGIESLRLGYRGVYIENWDWKTIYTINYCSRIASRLLLPLTRFKCFDSKSLYKGVGYVNWSLFIPEGATFAIDANVSHRELRNSLFAAQIVKDAICDQLREKTGRRPSINVQDPDVQLNLYIQNNMALLSFDTSGTPLYKRGYRQESVEAPLQENLAAAILTIAKYQADTILFDPCCGSGTFLIEAALMASRTAPGYLRRKWGFMRHPQFNQIEWLQVKNEWDKKRIPLQSKKIFGIDINKEAVRVAKINLKAAGFLQNIEISQSDFRDYQPSIEPSLIVTNPPYGKRMEEEERLIPLYRALGNFMKHKGAKPSKGFIFTGNLELTKEIGLASSRRYVLNNGGIESRLLEFDIY